MAVVLDASFAVASALGEMAEALRVDRGIESVARGRVIVPAVFWYEVRPALLRARRRRRVDQERFSYALNEFAELRTEADASHHEERVFSLAERRGLSFHDACYLETALRRGAALATLDRKLAAAAKAERVRSVVG